MLDHGPDRPDLGRVLAEIVEPGIATPIPAAMRVERARLDLREEDDEPVLVGDIGEARLHDEGVADLLARLLAAMEHGMDAAAGLAGAALGNEDHALIGEAVARAGKIALVEYDEAAR